MKIISAKYLKSSPNLQYCPDGYRPEYAFIGRSNVGKSSLINAICRRKTLVQTGPNPGKTQLTNFFDIVSEDKYANPVSWYLVDLPWYGYARVSKDKREQFETMIIDYLTKRENLTQIFVLIDSRIKPQQIDLEFLTRLDSVKRPYCLVFTKTDQTTQKQLSTNLKAFMIELKKHIDHLPWYFTTNAMKLGATKEVEDLIDEMNML